jgi:D-glycero-D-manno-heptose 1,7-bisphosphate phosphatase
MSGPSASHQGKRPAAFLDRDGTIIRDAAYVRDPVDVELLPGAGAAIRRLNDAGVAVIVVTNQSGIARGSLTTADYERVRARLDAMLAAEGARIDATYFCPHLPEITGPCDCRKPGLKLYRDAIAAHGLDASQSLFAGDRWRDVAPGRSLGGRSIMLDVASTPSDDLARAQADGIATAASLGDAVNEFLAALPAGDGRQ